MEPIIQIGETGLDLIHLIAIVVALGLAAAAYRLNEQYTRERATRADMETDLNHSELELARQRGLAEAAKLELAELKGQTAKQREEFSTLAQQVMKQAQSQFVELANETFEKHREGAKGELKELMKPIGENFTEFKKRVADIEKVRAEDKSAIQQQVKAIGESLHRNTAETGKLVNALTAPKGGGRWGEMTLRNVMEQAGLSAHCDFDEQVSDQTEDGRQRPDAVIHLPGGRQIVVDSKVSLEAYMAAASAEDPTQRNVHLKSHATNVQRHVDALASKRYQANLDERVDFVAMFIPGENFFAAALEYAPDLLERAYSRNVIVTTPSTLIGLAKTVAYVWRQEKMTENAREAAQLGQQLYERIAKMAEHIEKLGKALNSSVGHFNAMNSSLDKRVMPTMRKFEDLSIAPPDKPMPEPKRIEVTADAGTGAQLELIQKAKTKKQA
ncbi:MAG: DNA recombination protein RmuC [Pseudomonadota bacterium]